jgi:hypothetical protein
MKQYFEDFKKQYPKVAEAMGILGMTHEEYCEAYDRMVLQKFMRPLPVDTTGLTTPLPPQWRTWYSNSTAQKE